MNDYGKLKRAESVVRLGILSIGEKASRKLFIRELLQYKIVQDGTVCWKQCVDHIRSDSNACS